MLAAQKTCLRPNKATRGWGLKIDARRTVQSLSATGKVCIREASYASSNLCGDLELIWRVCVAGHPQLPRQLLWPRPVSN